MKERYQFFLNHLQKEIGPVDLLRLCLEALDEEAADNLPLFLGVILRETRERKEERVRERETEMSFNKCVRHSKAEKKMNN